MRNAYIITIGMMVAPCALPSATGKVVLPDDSAPQAVAGMQVLRDVEFLSAGRTEKADIYLPAKRPSTTQSPAVLIIHGGGWTTGDKAEEREINIATNLVRGGYVAMSINYL